MLQNSIELLKNARNSKCCVPAFNVYNLETITAAFSAAKKTEAPVIIAFGESYLKYASFDTISAIVRSLDKAHPFPVVLHLDHCKEPDNIKEAISSGFTSVMYDGSALPFEENIENSRSIVEYAHSQNVSMEGELGKLNEEGGAEGLKPAQDDYTDPDKAFEYVTRTRIDSLAVSVGNAHGLYHGIPHLALGRLSEIYDKTRIPLVLHGGSGIPDVQVLKAIDIAIAKINFNTELQLAGTRAIAEVLDSEDHRTCRMEKLTSEAQKQITSTMESIILQVYK